MSVNLALVTRPLPHDRVLVQLQGRLDAAAAPTFRARIQELVDRGRVEIVCDLSQVASLDSSGLAALVSARRVAREHGGFLKLVALSERAAGLFRRTMLDRVFEIHPSVEAALG